MLDYHSCSDTDILDAILMIHVFCGAHYGLASLRVTGRPLILICLTSTAALILIYIGCVTYGPRSSRGPLWCRRHCESPDARDTDLLDYHSCSETDIWDALLMAHVVCGARYWFGVTSSHRTPVILICLTSTAALILIYWMRY